MRGAGMPSFMRWISCPRTPGSLSTSVGSDYGDISVIRDAVDLAASSNVLVVCSAGNWPDRPNEAHYPSDYASTVSVTAITPDRSRAIYSFYGDAVDLAAPGGSGLNTASENITSSGLNDTTAVDFGTSFAAPHVVGVGALLLSHDPSLSANDVRARLEISTTPLADGGMGRGLVDAAAALGVRSTVSPANTACYAVDGHDAVNGLDAVNR